MTRFPSRDHLSAQFWRFAKRLGRKRAAIAVAHSILKIAWQLLTEDCDYVDLGGDYFVSRDDEELDGEPSTSFTPSDTTSPSNLPHSTGVLRRAGHCGVSGQAPHG